jgi:GTP:adenosylcobinamide-phosphate guanylyltransferase
MLDAALLAAGESDAAFRAAFGVTHKCLVPIAGRLMVHWVLDAVRGAALVDRLVVVGPAGPLRAAGVEAEIVPGEGGTFLGSLARGVDALAGERVLLIAGDVPLLRSAALDEFVCACLAMEADLCFPVVSWPTMQAARPGARKTWYDLRDGKLTKGNAVVARRDLFRSRLEHIETLFDARKEKKWTHLVGKAFTRRVLSRAAALADVEAGLSAYLHARVVAVPCHPELAIDVDEVADVAFVGAALAAACDASAPASGCNAAAAAGATHHAAVSAPTMPGPPFLRRR